MMPGMVFGMEEACNRIPKLDRDSAAYKALVEKRSYTGPMTIFGRDYQANYAPLIGDDGKVTGALFVGVPK